MLLTANEKHPAENLRLSIEFAPAWYLILHVQESALLKTRISMSHSCYRPDSLSGAVAASRNPHRDLPRGVRT
jgi:hypothetical protein